MAAPKSELVYFGSKRLFGNYLLPRRAKPQLETVVICPPYAHECTSLHRLMRQLSLRLSRAGFASLRFDYFGTGDSPGEDGDGNLESWYADCVAAVEFARERGAEKIHLLGLRLGANIAAHCANETNFVTSLIAWEAIDSGRRYAQYLRELQRNSQSSDRPAEISAADDALFGFRLNRDFEQQLSALELPDLTSRDGLNCLKILPSTQAPQSLSGIKTDGVEIAVCQQPLVDAEKIDRMVVPNDGIQTVVNWLGTAR